MKEEFKINCNFETYKEIFLNQNSILNLISKNDEKYLYEKHFYDSLSIKLFFKKYKINKGKLLDIGCGGGFPCVPIALECPNLQVIGIDSINKKINAIENIKESLDIKNLKTICGRVENIKNEKFDIITSRAVAKLDKISEYAIPLLSNRGYFVAYKSKKALEELEDAKPTLEKFNAKVIDIISYNLPLEDVYERNLIIITKKF